MLVDLIALLACAVLTEILFEPAVGGLDLELHVQNRDVAGYCLKQLLVSLPGVQQLLLQIAHPRYVQAHL